MSLLIVVFMLAFFAPLARTATPSAGQPPAGFGPLSGDISGSTVLALFVAVSPPNRDPHPDPIPTPNSKP